MNLLDLIKKAKMNANMYADEGHYGRADARIDGILVVVTCYLIEGEYLVTVA